MRIKDIDHLESLVGSIDKMISNAKNKGIINSKEITLLNLIYKLLKYNCSTNTNDDQRKLLNLYYKLFARYKFLCRAELTRDYNFFGNTNETYINTNPNTAPVIDDPDPIEPEPLPIICNSDITYQEELEFIYLEALDFTKCYESENDFKFLKIISLPEYGALQINDANAFIGQTIDLTSLNNDTIFIKYQNFLEVGETDSFQFQVSDNSVTPIYSETAVLTITKI